MSELSPLRSCHGRPDCPAGSGPDSCSEVRDRDWMDLEHLCHLGRQIGSGKAAQRFRLWREIMVQRSGLPLDRNWQFALP
jgi:hypothetical protein